MTHHAPIGPSAPVDSRLLIVLAAVLGVGPGSASAASPPATMRHLVADDAAGRVQPHLVLGQPARFAEGQVPADRVAADDPARTIVHDPGAVVYEYRGLDAAARYTARLTFLSDHPSGPRFPRRVVRVRADDDVLADAVDLPEDELLSRDVELRREGRRSKDTTRWCHGSNSGAIERPLLRTSPCRRYSPPGWSCSGIDPFRSGDGRGPVRKSWSRSRAAASPPGPEPMAAGRLGFLPCLPVDRTR